jgi:hypothetical protein
MPDLVTCLFPSAGVSLLSRSHHSTSVSNYGRKRPVAQEGYFLVGPVTGSVSTSAAAEAPPPSS